MLEKSAGLQDTSLQPGKVAKFLSIPLSTLSLSRERIG